MAWTEPEFSRNQVNRAGAALIGSGISNDEFDIALEIINNWRAAHSFPLNTIQMALRRKSEKFENTAIIAQRIKRLQSIHLKLSRFPTMKLSQMQDIGGCRSILQSVRTVRMLSNDFHDGFGKHKLHSCDDYIKSPQKSGYRGIHFIYRYFSDRNEKYNDLKIEIQLRSRLQHAWATAVETIGTFTRQSLKSSQGEAEWLEFFALMGSFLAIRERTTLVPGLPDSEDVLIRALRERARALRVERRLQTYGRALRTLDRHITKDTHYYLLRLEPARGTVTISGYRSRDFSAASDAYLRAEQEIRSDPSAEAVLVSVKSIEALKKAYPNYFLDTAVFLSYVRKAVEKGRSVKRRPMRPAERQTTA